jgi:acetyl-CoA carboxylase biotin carboxyl carrier protein
VTDTEQHLADLKQLIDEFKRSGLHEMRVRHGDFELFLSQDANASGLDGGGAAPAIQVQRAVPAAAPASPAGALQVAAQGPAAQAVPAGAVVVCAPYLGTFYRSPKPGTPPYVEVGAAVSAESELCLVEVMKLFTAVRAGIAGKVVQVLAEDGELVATDQPLFALMPD